jgi:NADH-quinone oxidoreductase subunit L
MIYPLIVLAVGALLAGFLNTPAWHGLGNFLGASPSFQLGYAAAAMHQGVLPVAHLDPLAFGQHVEGAHGGVHWGPMLLSILVAGAGIGLAYLMHLKDRRWAERLAGQMPMVTRVLEAKYWLDELYAAAVVEPLAALGRMFYVFDRVIIDGLVWLVSFVPQAGGWVLKLGVQRGYMQGYAAVMLFGIAIILLIIFL